MTFATNMKNLALLSILLLSLVSARAEQLASGAFTLRMTIPEISKKDIELTGTLKLTEKRFTFETVDAGGDPLTIQGVITKDGLLMWISANEREYLVTFHLTGILGNDKESSASGKVSVFKDHERIAQGEWKLQKRSEQ
jgi:hypothetical protein